jgi:putative transposase
MKRIYPKGYGNLKEVQQVLRRYFEFYKKQPHQGLKYRTPAEVYFGK